jgi:hypothetical protein
MLIVGVPFGTEEHVTTKTDERNPRKLTPAVLDDVLHLGQFAGANDHGSGVQLAGNLMHNLRANHPAAAQD